MRRKHVFSSLLGVLVLSSIVLAGCQSSGSTTPASAEPSTQAAMCPKCQITWVKAPVHGGKGTITSYRTRQSMECPDCKSAVANFFSTGKLEHTCATCGSDLSACEVH